ncbi:C-C chemokine receptor type 10 isoform X2 [Genypterus blacodes]|uniref:C-C chemokine receptor type 10 isoform X2 n=1 Tax=Genypterus blacodes TaxID=154954 RepID=UPI003F7684F0
MIVTSNSSVMSLTDHMGDYKYGYIDDIDYLNGNIPDDHDFPNYTDHDFTNYTDHDFTNYTYTMDNLWCEPGDQETTIKMFQTCVFCLIFPLGVVGNCLVIATFALYRRLRLRSMTDVFLFHLALADLLLLLTLPLQAVDTHRGWIFPVLLCKATRACYAINTYSGLLLLACISVDRYMVVARAQEVLRLRRQILRAGKMAAVGVWLVALLLSLPEILFSGVSQSGNETYCGMQKRGRVKMATNGAIIGVFCVSFLLMVTCYSLIARVLWEGHAQRRGKQWHRQRTLKLMVALVLVFLFFQLPYTAVLSRKMAGPFCQLLLEYITCTLAFTRCCLNPVLYALVGVRFRNDVLKLIQDAGCSCSLLLGQQLDSSTSMSPSSPAVTALALCSPTSSDRGYSSPDAATPSKFRFSVTK